MQPVGEVVAGQQAREPDGKQAPAELRVPEIRHRGERSAERIEAAGQRVAALGPVRHWPEVCHTGRRTMCREDSVRRMMGISRHHCQRAGRERKRRPE